MARVQPLIEQAELLLDQTAAPYLLGELNFFKGNLLYWQGQAERSIQTLEEALAQTPDAHTLVKSNIELMLGLARHANGQKASAIRALNARIHTADPSQFFLLGHLISGLAFIHLLSGELAQARQQARRMQMVNAPLGNVTTDAWGWYLRASTHLNTYNLEQACQCFAVAVQQRYTLDRPAIMDAYAGLALVQQLGGQEGEVTQTLDRLLALARELNAPQNLLVAHSCAARLALLRGDLLSAADWARSFEESVEPTGMFFWLEVPAITKARVLIADGTQESLEQACELLARIRQQSDESHFSCQTIEVAVLQPLALQGQGCTDQALAALKEAIALAKPGGWIRPFVELGQPMEDLLNQLKVQDAADRIAIDRILSAFPKGDQTRPLQITPPSSKSYSPGSTPLDSLTKREHQTLRLLATGVSTEEVASEMVVTVSTVRTYAKRIYAKLGVNSRFEAVAKAQKMGLV